MIDVEEALVQVLVYIGKNHPLPPQTEEEHRAEILRLFPPAPCRAENDTSVFSVVPVWFRDAFGNPEWCKMENGMFITGIDIPQGKWRRLGDTIAAEMTAAGFKAKYYYGYLYPEAVDPAESKAFSDCFFEIVSRLRRENNCRYRKQRKPKRRNEKMCFVQKRKNKAR